MAIGRSVNFMAGLAALDSGCIMFVHKRAAFVGMALQAGLVLESGQAFSYGRLMGIMAGCAAHDPFLQPVSLIQLKL